MTTLHNGGESCIRAVGYGLADQFYRLVHKTYLTLCHALHWLQLFS